MNPLRAHTAALALALAAILAAGPAAASEFRLGGTPSSTPCRVDPFADDSAAQREASWGRRCGGEHLRLGFEPAGRSALRARLNSVMTERFHPPIGVPLISSIRLAWSAIGDVQGGGLRTEQGILAAGSSVRLGEQWRLRAKVGRELVGGLRTRTTFSSVWRPSRGLVFAEWAGTEDHTEMHRIGARWWLVPRRLALDIGARYLPDGIGWVDQGIRLSLFALHL